MEMTKLQAVRNYLLDKRQRGELEFGFVQLAEEICRAYGMTYQDTIRKYLRHLLCKEIPTEIVRKGVYRFIVTVKQGNLFGG